MYETRLEFLSFFGICVTPQGPPLGTEQDKGETKTISNDTTRELRVYMIKDPFRFLTLLVLFCLAKRTLKVTAVHEGLL